MPANVDFKVLLFRPMVLETSYSLDRNGKSATHCRMLLSVPVKIAASSAFLAPKTAHGHCSLEDKRGPAR